MGGIKRVGDLHSDIEDFIHAHGFAADLLPQIFALQQLHDEERLALVFFDLVDGANVGMIQQRGGAGLALEALQRFFIFVKVFRQKLGGHPAFEVDVLGLVHHTHAARAQLTQNAVVGDGAANHGAGPYALWAEILGWGQGEVNEIGFPQPARQA